MNNKKKIVLGICALVAIALVVTIFAFHSPFKSAGITRFEWVEMISAKFNMTAYQSSSPYFSDVSSSNEHFTAVQSAYEWDVLDDSTNFEGNKKVDGEYAALTAMRAIGAYKIKIYLGLSELPSDDQLIELAISEGLIDKSELGRKISEKKATEIISSAYELYSGKMWVDDYYNYTYSENVIEIEKEDVISYDSAKEEIVLDDKAKSIITSGNIIVFYDNDGFKVSKIVDHIGADGKVTLSGASIEDTIDEFVMSDLFLSDDIFNAIFEQSPDGISSTGKTNDLYQVIPVKAFEASSKGVSISVKVTESEAEVTIKSNDLDVEKSAKYAGNFFKKSAIPDISEEYVEFTTEVTKINVGVQSDYSLFNGNKFNYFLTQIETEMETKFEAGGNVEAVIPLSTVTLAGNDLIAAVNLELKLVITMDGKVSITADFPSEAVFEYRKDSGVRHYANSTANVQAEMCCSLEESLRFEPIIVLLKNKILDLDLDIGAGATASIKTRNNSNVRTCLDISSYAPLFSLGYLNDEDSLLGDYLEGNSLEIITSDNAPFRESFHYEFYSDGTSKVVPECTYKVDDSIRLPDIDLSLPHYYYAIFYGDISDEADHYEVVGSLLEEVYFETEQLKNLSEGGSITCDNHQFMCVEIIKDEETERYKYIEEQNNWTGGYDSILKIKNRYYVFDNGYVSIYDPSDESFSFDVDGTKYNYLYSIQANDLKEQLQKRTIDSKNFNLVLVPVLMTVDDNYTFWIDKNTCSNAKSIISKDSVYRVHFELEGAPQEMVEQWYSSGMISWGGVQGITPYAETPYIISE